jgi:hypothetical protein
VGVSDDTDDNDDNDGNDDDDDVVVVIVVIFGYICIGVCVGWNENGSKECVEVIEGEDGGETKKLLKSEGEVVSEGEKCAVSCPYGERCGLGSMELDLSFSLELFIVNKDSDQH